MKSYPITKESIIENLKQGRTDIDWRRLDSEHEKNEWLKACLLFSGLPRQQILRSVWIIDGNHVASETDFFCLLGETFFGYGGYFGQDPNGFNDCFSEIQLHEKSKPAVEPGTAVVFKNAVALREMLGGKYFSHVIGDFRRHGFDVVLE